MGNNNPKQLSSSEGKVPTSFREILDAIFKKALEMQDIIRNIKSGGMGEHVARPYLADVLLTLEEELSILNRSLSRKPTHSRHEHTYQQQQQEKSIKPNRDEHSNIDTIDAMQKQFEKSVQDFNVHFDELRKEKEDLNKIIEEHAKRSEMDRDEIQKLKAENQKVYLRLSKLSSEKLTINNPSIADLSDPLRPTKLVEIMSELYDDEWTDAFTALKALGKDDKKSVKILLDTFLITYHTTCLCKKLKFLKEENRRILETKLTKFKDVFQFCKSTSSEMLLFTENHVKELFENTKGPRNESANAGNVMSTTTVQRSPHQRRGQMRPNDESHKPPSPSLSLVFLEWREKDQQSELEESVAVDETVLSKFEEEQKNLRKSFGNALVPIITKAYLRPRWTKICISALKPYIQKSVHVAWMMCIQTPPMGIVPPPRSGESFDKNLYNTYQTRGQIVEYTVWPAVLLKEPESKIEKLTLMRKGVVEGTDFIKGHAGKNPIDTLSGI